MAHDPIIRIFPQPGVHGGPVWRNMKVGLLGGSFNPAHEGHLHISELALKLLGLDCIWWMVSPQNPLKPSHGMAAAQKRLDYARRVATNPRIVVTDIETRLGTQFTADTLEKLHQRYAHTVFVWLMGADNLHQVHRWQRWEEIFSTTPVAVFNRPPFTQAITNAPAANRYRTAMLPPDKSRRLVSLEPPVWTLFHTPLNPQSATDIREKSADWG